MADQANYVKLDRDVEQALAALKKGSQLIKYSRKGKPKVCPFRLSSDESELIWLSHRKEKVLNLASIVRIIPGQRTAVFRRFLRPEKDYLSFSLIYKNGERSLDLICKDQTEVENWFTSLKSLISTHQRRKTRFDGSNDGLLFPDDVGGSTHSGRSFDPSLDNTRSISHRQTAGVCLDYYARDPSLNYARSDAGSPCANMLRQGNGDGVRLSVSSVPSSSSQGSGPDDIESLGDVYVWGELWCDGAVADSLSSPICLKADILLPKPLESNVVLDVQQIACGVRHVALITRHGEIFTWGEELGGRLGHGNDIDISRPRLVESLVVCSMDYVACGEYHTCAISTLGDLFIWGDGTHNIGLLGNQSDASHWIPRRVSGPLEGLQVLSVACGTWHTALVTVNGKVFTFGDGSFGVLGHGDRESVTYPKEVEQLSGLRTVKVACGLWHTAAIVEVMWQTGGNVLSRKLFTWGDGKKNRLGHGDNETRLVPTCVSSLIDYNFHQLACSHYNTIALTTSGHVFTMGSPEYGVLGNPISDGKFPCLVQDRLVGELVEEIACGAYHIAVLTSRGEVYTWGMGANGRLGHGDCEDRRVPVLVEAFRDRHVKSITCGSSFTACICIHKWVSGADQSLCSGCRQAFGFTRKRHNCYNCGLVHCHACSSKKVLKAALAPTSGKPHRVCDSCYVKLKGTEASNISTPRRNVITRQSIDGRERLEKRDVRGSSFLLSPNAEQFRLGEIRPVKHEMKLDSSSSPVRSPQVPSLLQLKDITFPSSLSALQTALKPIVTSSVLPPASAKPSSPYMKKPNHSNAITPIFSKSVIDSLKKTNEALNQEVLNLQEQVKHLRQRCEIHDSILEKAEKKSEAEASKCNAAFVVIKSLDEQLKNVAEKVPPEVNEIIKAINAEAELFLGNNSGRSTEFSSLINGSSDMDHHNHELGSSSQYRNNSVMETPNSQLSAESSTGSSTASSSARGDSNEGETQVTEQFEPGVYVTVARLPDGTKIFKRVRFSRRKFEEQQAEDWWTRNKDKVYKKYNYRGSATTASIGATPPSEEETSKESSI